MCKCVSFFFFQAEDGIRDVAVTGVQTCALPIHDHREKDRQRGLRVPVLDREEEREESAEEVPGREEAREQEDPSRPPLPQVVPATTPQAFPVPSNHGSASRRTSRGWGPAVRGEPMIKLRAP